MKDYKHEGKETKPELKAGSQDNRNNVNKQQPNAYNPQQRPLDKTNQQPLPGKGQTIGGQQGGAGITNREKNLGTGKVDFNNKEKGSWK